jgi:ATP-binding cassette subfamily F protein uup
VPAQMPVRKAKLTYKDQRDYEILPARVEELSAEIAKLETALHDADLYSKNPARFAQLTAVLDKARADKDAAEERWLELAEMVEG